MKRITPSGFVTLLLALAGCAGTPAIAPQHDHRAAREAAPKPVDRNRMWQASLARAPLSATAAFDRQGKLWLARIENGHLRLRVSTDNGNSFGAPATVNAEPERIAADGENRPKLAFGDRQEIYVSWTRSGAQPFSGDVRFARSRDGGRTFSAPITVNNDHAAISHRFDSLTVTPDGRIHLLWLDKRESAAAQMRGGKYAGISLYYAVSTDRGASFPDNRKLADHTCECCRIALALDTDGAPVAMWRHVFGTNIRDHALLRIGTGRAPRRVTQEAWAVDACPHHGPALAIGADGRYHLAWFSGAPGKAGLYYARSDNRGRTTTAPLRVGNPDRQAGRATLVTIGREVVLAWKEFDGQTAVLRAMRSMDGGAHWSAPEDVTRSSGSSDHPQLLAQDGKLFIAWNTVNEGFRLLALSETGVTP